jgi:hypothetical protein
MTGGELLRLSLHVAAAATRGHRAARLSASSIRILRVRKCLRDNTIAVSTKIVSRREMNVSERLPFKVAADLQKRVETVDPHNAAYSNAKRTQGTGREVGPFEKRI